MARRSVDIFVRGRDQGASRTLRSVGDSATSMGASIMRRAIPALTAMVSAFAGFRIIRRIISDYATLEQSQRSLATALELAGASVRDRLPELLDLANEIERTTTVTAGSFTELLAQAARLGIAEDQLGDVARATVALAEVTEQDLTTSLRAVALATEGEFMMLNRYIPALRAATTDSEKFAVLNETINRGMALARDRTNTLAGSYQQFTNAMEAARETIGERLAPSLRLLTARTDEARSFLDRAADTIGTYLADSIDGAMVLMRLFQTAWDNLGSIVELSWTNFRLFAVRSFNILHHLFTVQIPAVLEWFVDNWRNLFTDLFNFNRTLFTNMVGNIVDIISNIPALLRGDTSIAQLWTPLTDGFEATLQSLPPIMEREIGALEASLDERSRALGATLREAFTDALIGPTPAQTRRPRGSGGDDTFDPITLPQRARDDDDDDATSPAATTARQAARQQLRFEESRLLTRGAGDVVDVDRQMLRNAEEQKREQREQTKVLGIIMNTMQQIERDRLVVVESALT